MAGKPGQVWPSTGRARALELAEGHASNEDIVDVLREEFPGGRHVDREQRFAEAQTLVDELSDELDRRRTIGRLSIMSRLVEISRSDSREAMTATSWLAREILGHAHVVDARTKQLVKLFRGYTAGELRQVMHELAQRFKAPNNVLTLGGDK